MATNEKYTESPILVPAVEVSSEPAKSVQATGLSTQVTTSVTETVQVVAPSNLQGGYHLQVTVNGQNRIVVVPSDGVVTGQTFTGALLVDPNQVHVFPIKDNDDSSIPHGAWRDGLCDCCTHGCCHSMCCFAYWFMPVVLGQIMTRMSLNWIGGRGQPPSRSNTCMIITIFFLLYIVVDGIVYDFLKPPFSTTCNTVTDPSTNGLSIRCVDREGNEVDFYSSSPLRIFYSVWSAIWFLFIMIILIRTRLSIRNKFDIPAKCCGVFEDCCCSFWCACCTVTQMARHTNDYNEHTVECCSSSCCNKRGQRLDVPEIV